MRALGLGFKVCSPNTTLEHVDSGPCPVELRQKRARAVSTCGWLSKLRSLLGTLNNRCRIIIGTQKGTMVLTTTHVNPKKTLL